MRWKLEPDRKSTRTRKVAIQLCMSAIVRPEKYQTIETRKRNDRNRLKRNGTMNKEAKKL